MFAGIKNIRIFELFNANEYFKKAFLAKGIFYAKKSGYQTQTNRFAFMLKGFSLARMGAIAFIISKILIFHKSMPTKMKITHKPKTSKLTSTSVARNATPTLTLTGVKNPYLFCLRKIFQDFLKEQQSGHLFAESRLLRKIEGAILMFPEGHQELLSNLKK